MQCIFCHKESSNSKSVEHIIPESLGNKHHYLPKGYVCDECNHYFAIKVENELLSQPYFISMRFRNEILTKKGKLVRQKMIFPGAMKCTEIVMQKTGNGLIASFDDEELYEAIKAGKTRMINRNEDIVYETLHEMKLFTKEYKRFPNGQVEAEIYFVLAIAGIEFAICVSDPDISNYQKWLNENEGRSPLEDNDESMLSYGLSDINPNLIKKNDDRIH